MSQKAVSRRSALGMIAKTGALGAGACFFISLKTRPLAGQTRKRPGRVKYAAENVVISGTGSTLMVKVSGPPGRHCGIAYATTDRQEDYKAVQGGQGVIGKDGLCTLQVDVKSLPNQKVFLRIVTGNTGSFDDELAGTEAFVVNISGKAIAGFDGVKTRPLVDSRNEQVAVASFAAACITVKRR